jgi:hypothetical protein
MFPRHATEEPSIATCIPRVHAAIPSMTALPQKASHWHGLGAAPATCPPRHARQRALMRPRAPEEATQDRSGTASAFVNNPRPKLARPIYNVGESAKKSGPPQIPVSPRIPVRLQSFLRLQTRLWRSPQTGETRNSASYVTKTLPTSAPETLRNESFSCANSPQFRS